MAAAEFLVMCRITVSRFTAYNPESGSCSETRNHHTAERRPGQVLGQDPGNPGSGFGGGNLSLG